MLLNKAEVASLFHVSVRTVSTYVKSGRLPRPISMGQKKLWVEKDLHELISGYQQVVTAAAKKTPGRKSKSGL